MLFINVMNFRNLNGAEIFFMHDLPSFTYVCTKIIQGIARHAEVTIIGMIKCLLLSKLRRFAE